MTRLDQIDPDSPETHVMSFGDHLEELRTRVIRALLFPIPVAVLTWFFSGDLLNLLCLPLVQSLRRAGLSEQLQVLSPAEALMTQIKISLIAALIVSAPWIIWQAWLFVRPGLYRRERRFVYFLLPGSGILTVAAIFLFYYVMLPLVLIVLVNFGTRLDQSMAIEPPARESAGVDPETLPRAPVLANPPAQLEAGMIWFNLDHEMVVVVPKKRGVDPANPPLDKNGNPLPPELEIRRIPIPKAAMLSQAFRLTTYVNFVLVLALGVVIAFQTPLVILLLGWVDLVRVQWLRANRKYALFVAAVLAAVLTPADPWSMIAMLIPLYLLFEFGIILLALFPAQRVAEGRLFGGRRGESQDRPDQ